MGGVCVCVRGGNGLTFTDEWSTHVNKMKGSTHLAHGCDAVEQQKSMFQHFLLHELACCQGSQG